MATPTLTVRPTPAERALAKQVARDLRRDSTYRRLMREAQAQYDREMAEEAALRLLPKTRMRSGQFLRRADGKPRPNRHMTKRKAA